MARKQNITDTISNKDWNRLRARARKANPYLDDLTDPRAIKRRKQSAQQVKNARWN
jgi:hypothetical protein